MLTTAQGDALVAAIDASTEPAIVAALAARDDGTLLTWCNADSAFIVYKTSVSNEQIGDAMNGTEVAGLSSLGMQRLQVLAAYSGGTQNPSRADRRAAFDAVFNGAGGNVTRPALAALWRRPATNAEKVFTTGTGTTVDPGALVVEGKLGIDELSQALNRNGY